MFVMSFMAGYIIGKGKIVFPKKLTEEDKKEIERFENAVEEYNKTVNNWVGFGDIDG